LADLGDSPAIVALKLGVQKAIDAGELAKADALLEDIALEQRHSVERSAINLASTLARRAEIALSRLRYGEAAGHFASAAAVLPSEMDHGDKRISYLISEASALYHQDEEFGDNAALLSAIERFQWLVTLAPRARVLLAWAQTQNNLGNALLRLGERESGTSRLDEAVAPIGRRWRKGPARGCRSNGATRSTISEPCSRSSARAKAVRRGLKRRSLSFGRH
jgi:tetratricopeptide (TPR) repeat protein